MTQLAMATGFILILMGPLWSAHQSRHFPHDHFLRDC